MPTPTPPGLRIGTATPAEAFSAFSKRGLLQPTFNWYDLWQDEHAGKFMVAGVAQADVLGLFRSQLDDALRKGTSLADFSKALRPQLQAKGWWGDIEITDSQTGEIRTTRFNDARLRLIYDTNLRQSYAAGRWAQAQRNKARKPFLLYRTMRDERVRQSHARWDGVALPVDHPWWHTHYPPNGWRCRCRAIAVSERDLARYAADGVQIRRDAPDEPALWVRDPRTGDSVPQPLGIDPGWAYNAGRAALQQPAELLRGALDALPPELARAQVQQVVRSGEFARFLREPRPGEMLPVGVMLPEQAQAIGARTRTVMMSEAGARQQAKTAPGMTPAEYLWVQRALQDGRRIADEPNGAVYVLQADGWVVVVRLQRSGTDVLLPEVRRLPLPDARRDPDLRPLLRDIERGGDA